MVKLYQMGTRNREQGHRGYTGGSGGCRRGMEGAQRIHRGPHGRGHEREHGVHWIYMLGCSEVMGSPVPPTISPTKEHHVLCYPKSYHHRKRETDAETETDAQRLRKNSEIQ